MAKSSKFSRLQRQRGGRSISSVVQYRMPKMPRLLDRLTPEMEFRFRCVDYVQKTSVAAAMEIFHRSRATIYRWIKAFTMGGIRALAEKSRRPKRTRWRQRSEAAKTTILRLRHQHRRAGKAKLRALLALEAILLSESTIGRILASLKRRYLLVEPVQGVRTKRRPTRP